MNRKRRKQFVYSLIFVAAFFSFFFQKSIPSSIKSSFIQIITSPTQFFSSPLIELRKIIYYHRIFDEYKHFKNENGTLKARLIGLEELARENARLGKLLDFKKSLVYSSVAANVIGRDPTRWDSSLLIDKGMDDGIKTGMPVVNTMGMVGKIIEAGQKTSKVILLTDPQFSVAALVERTRESGLVSGTLQGLCRLRYINEDADVQIGDKVITSKLSQSFPEGLLIGEIIGIEEHLSPSIGYLIRPSIIPSEMEEVLVIIQ